MFYFTITEYKNPKGSKANAGYFSLLSFQNVRTLDVISVIWYAWLR